jgi:hypothetical protein
MGGFQPALFFEKKYLLRGAVPVMYILNRMIRRKTGILKIAADNADDRVF